jgi:hypothetical protein
VRDESVAVQCQLIFEPAGLAIALGAARARTPQVRVGNQPALALLAPVAPSAGPGGAVRLTLASPPRDVPAPAPG